MEIHRIIAEHRSKKVDEEKNDDSIVVANEQTSATHSEIPDIFFEEILVRNKLSRIDIIVLMYLYRKVWCRPNLYKEYGISPMFSLAEIARILNLSIDELYHAFRHLEDLEFISTIRSGQYFVRKYFTREYDEKYGQAYDDFDL